MRTCELWHVRVNVVRARRSCVHVAQASNARRDHSSVPLSGNGTPSVPWVTVPQPGRIPAVPHCPERARDSSVHWEGAGANVREDLLAPLAAARDRIGGATVHLLTCGTNDDATSLVWERCIGVERGCKQARVEG